MKKSNLKYLSIFLLSILVFHADAQSKKQNIAYSDPHAPVGNKNLTVPASVVPLADIWMRDAFITYGEADGIYYMTGTTATPGRVFKGQVHCWDYNDGIYMWKSKDMKNWEPMGRVWSFDADAADWQKKVNL